MLYANQVLKKDSGVIDVLGHARELGKTGIGPFSRVKRVASYDFSPRRSRELYSGFVHIVVGGRIVTNPGTDSQHCLSVTQAPTRRAAIGPLMLYGAQVTR